MGVDQGTDPQEQVLEGGHVAPWGAAVAVQQREGLERADHLGRFPVGQRGDAHGHVLEQLHRRPPGPAGDHGAEGGVVDLAGTLTVALHSCIRLSSW
jgi:hypothetical protein